jgi:VWFA-related protein
VGGIVALLLLVVVAGDARGDAALTTADIVRFLRAGISEQTIQIELTNRGFAEPLDAAREASLREAGASETLIVAIRRVAPPAPQPATSRAPALEYAPGVTVTPNDGHEPTFEVAARTVRVPVSVLDRAGQPVLGLNSSDFRVSENGRRQEVSLFSGERRPLRLALALDVSGSMTDKIRQVEASLRHFIALLEPADQILVMTFNQELHIEQDLTSDREALARVLEDLAADGGTALYDAAFEAIRRVATGPAECKALVLVTDGVDTASSTAFSDLREFARRKEVPVFSIGLDSGNDPIPDIFRRPPPTWPGGRPPRDPGTGPYGWPPRPPGTGPQGWPGGGGGRGWPGGSVPRAWGEPRGWSAPLRGFDAGPLLELAEQTGGRAVIVSAPQHRVDGERPGGDQLKKAVESIAIVLRHRYLLGYEPPEGKRGWREIEVEVDRSGMTAHARKGYYAGG